jgi:hypothetical protein
MRFSEQLFIGPKQPYVKKKFTTAARAFVEIPEIIKQIC